MNKIEQFIESIQVPNTAKVVKFVLKNTDINIENFGLIELEKFILDRKVSSPKEIITICYVLGLYAKWLGNDGLYQMIQSLNKKLLWDKSKPNAKKKFISYKQYEQIVKDIATFEEYNALYFELLFSCIYNGIYNQDMSVLKNLRRSDIQEDGIIILREDNSHTYKIKVSERLAKDLIQLSTIDEWIRPNRFNLCHVEMKGVYSDSVFKVENRSTNSEDSYKFSYYSKLRKIGKEYIGYSLLPLQLYASGIMHRIKIELDKNNISLEEAFAKSNRNRIAHIIIEKELVRCNSGIEMSNFRELIKGHLDSF